MAPDEDETKPSGQEIRKFLDWLDRRGVHLVTWERGVLDPGSYEQITNRKIEALLAKYLESESGGR